MPVLKKISDEFADTKPFEGLKIGACLHITNETMGLVYALRAGGAQVYLCASNPLSTQDDVADIMRNEGISVFGKHGDIPEEYAQNIESVAQMNCDFIIDDGADLTVKIHNLAVTQDHFIMPKGGLEETTAGVNRIRRMAENGSLKYPILAVNDSPTKHLFDNVYGTGQSTIDGILRATNVMLAGKTFVIAGYGNCGKGLAQRAKGMGCNVIITEIDPVKALQAQMDGFQVVPMKVAALIGDIFVTVTGNKDVITRDHMELMRDDVILANSGHFDVEIDVKAAKELKLNILADGRLVNLVCAQGHPAEVMDMSFSNQALGLQYLIETIGAMPAHDVFNIPRRISDRIARMKLESMGIVIDTLTEAQDAYLKSWL